MESLLLYLLKSAALLSIFYLVYTFLLKNDTSFQANRHFLFCGILAAAVLPTLEFTRTVYVESLVPTGNFLIPSEALQDSHIPAEETHWWQILGLIYLVGLGFMLLRFLFQLYSILKIIKNQPKKQEAGFNMISSNMELAPFSFFRTIVFNPNLHPPEELKIILEHEKVHARQWHSADVLLSHLITAVLWFNPLSWYYRKSIIQNLEFVADREAVATSASKTSYQHALVKIAVADFQPALANNFNQPLIKKRIMMLNKKPSQEKTLWKMGLSIPIILIFMICFQVKTEAQILAQAGSETSEVITEVKISSTITKESEDKTLEQLEKLFEKQGVELDFSTVRRSRDGDITKIKFSYKTSSGSESGNFSRADSEGIDPFSISLENGKFGISEGSSVPISEPSPSLFSKLGNEPLLVINGKEYKSAELHGNTIQIQGGFSFFSREESIDKLGSKAKDGVILIPRGIILEDFPSYLKQIDTQEAGVTRSFISIKKGNKPFFLTLEKNGTGNNSSSKKSGYGEIIPDLDKINASQSPTKITKIFPQDSIKPLIVIDGKVMDKTFDVNDIDPNDIAIVNVQKADKATETYGGRAKNGVIEIRLKSEAGSSADAKIDRMEALYVVDGIVMDENFNSEDINPEDIELINVIKDEHAIAKYGDKAKNGVIEITTKD